MTDHDPEATTSAGAPRSTVVVVTGGDPLPAAVAGLVPAGAYVIAADSGIDHALGLGLKVDLAIGDFDSVTPAGLRAVTEAGARIEQHPSAKDATDLELALDAAHALGPDEIVVVGGHGGRLDHLLGGMLALTSDAYAAIPIRAVTGEARVYVVRSTVEIPGAPGGLLTLLAIGGPAHGVRTTGLRYPLEGEALMPGSTRGVSNEFCAPVATVSLTSGVLLAVAPTVTPSDPPTVA